MIIAVTVDISRYYKTVDASTSSFRSTQLSTLRRSTPVIHCGAKMMTAYICLMNVKQNIAHTASC